MVENNATPQKGDGATSWEDTKMGIIHAYLNAYMVENHATPQKGVVPVIVKRVMCTMRAESDQRADQARRGIPPIPCNSSLGWYCG